MNRLFLLLTFFFSGFLAEHASAQVYISPDVETLRPGDWVYVTNAGKAPAKLEIKLSDGTVLSQEVLPGKKSTAFMIPESVNLIGQKIKVRAQHPGGPTEKTYGIVMFQADPVERTHLRERGAKNDDPREVPVLQESC